MDDRRTQTNRSGQAKKPSWANMLAKVFVAVAVAVILFMTGSATLDALNAQSGGNPVVSSVQSSQTASSASGASASEASGLAATTGTLGASSAASDAAASENSAESIGDDDVPMVSGLDPAVSDNSRVMGLSMRWVVAVATVVVIAVCALLMRRLNRSIAQMKGRFR